MLRASRAPRARWIARFACPLLVLTVVLAASVRADDASADGLTSFKAGRYDEALEAFQVVARREPDRADAAANVGATLGRLGRNDESVTALEHALELGPDPRVEAAIRYDLGNAHLALGRIDDAIGDFRASLALNPNDEQAKVNLEIALRRRKSAPPASGGGSAADSDAAAPAPVAAGGQDAPAVPNEGPRKMSTEEAERLLDALGRRERLEFPRGSKRPVADPSVPDW